MCDSVSPPSVVHARATSMNVLIILCKNYSRVLRSMQTNGLANARGRPLTALRRTDADQTVLRPGLSFA